MKDERTPRALAGFMLLDGVTPTGHDLTDSYGSQHEVAADPERPLDERLAAFEDVFESEVGDTTITRARNIERSNGFRQLFLKFEGSNPSGTQKDRIAFAQALDALRRGYDTLTVATCGNYGVATAMAARMSGLRCVVYIPAGYHTDREDALWVPHVICQTMIAAGLGTVVVSCLQRLRVVVQQSTRSAADERLSPSEHADSMAVEGVLELGSKILLVDDVVTRGSTLTAAASLILHHAPSIDVMAFAIARVAQEPLTDVGEMLAPAMEVITCDEAGISPVRRGA